MKTIKFSALLVFSFLFVGLVLVTTVDATDSATVTADVDIEVIEVTVEPSTFAYGTMAFGDTKESFDVIDEGGVYNIKAEVGNVATALDISGANTGDWTLASEAGVDEYVHGFTKAVDGTSQPSDYAALTTSNTTLEDSVEANGETWFGLEIQTPTSGTAEQQSVEVTLTASSVQ